MLYKFITFPLILLKKEEVETFNRADQMIYEFEKQLRDNGDKLSEEDKATVQGEIDSFKKVREGNDPEAIKTAMESMAQKLYAVFGKLYQQQGGDQAQAGPEPNSQNPDGSVNGDGQVD